MVRSGFSFRLLLFLVGRGHMGIGRAHGLAQEDGTHQQAHQFRNGERQPYQLQPSRLRQQPRSRQQHHQLAANGVDEAVDRIADRLEYAAGDDAESRNGEVDTDDPQSHHQRY